MQKNSTIFSWNINRNNFLNEEKFLILKNYDVIFLQEVSLSSLNFLMSFSDIYEIFYAREILKTFNKSREYFLVTLIRKSLNFKVKKSEVFSIKTFQPPIYKLIGRKIYIEFISIDLVTGFNSRNYCLINCHLQFACSPENRRNQFREILMRQKAENLIIGGDLNIFICPPLSLFFWFFMDIKLSDLFKIESHEFLKSFPNFSVLSKTNTTIYKSGKLDYILFSGNIKGISEIVLTESRMGSDHFPLVSSIKIA